MVVGAFDLRGQPVTDLSTTISKFVCFAHHSAARFAHTCDKLYLLPQNAYMTDHITRIDTGEHVPTAFKVVRVAVAQPREYYGK